MTDQVLERVAKLVPQLRDQAAECEKLGRLPEATAAALRDTGLLRMLQPTEWGGFESKHRDFLEAVMLVSAGCGSTGWVAGVVGVHPWELALYDERAQEDVWGTDADTWFSSSYAPQGKATMGDGGFVLRGRWSFSSGCDHATWVLLGGLVVDPRGVPVTPEQRLHFLVPRPDYQIVDDSWNVVGLQGSGSKDVIVEEAFAPAHRVLDHWKVLDGRAASEAGRDEPLYRLPFAAAFPTAITAAVIGTAEGALAAALDYQASRVTSYGTVVADDPYAMEILGQAAADIAASRAQLLTTVDHVNAMVAAGEDVTIRTRAQCRRDQVSAGIRAVSAVDHLFAACGGNALRLDKPLQRLWRDAHAGLNHVIHVSGPVYHAAAAAEFGDVPQELLTRLIL